MRAALLALCFFALVFGKSAPKVLGTRTIDNIPADWKLVGPVDDSHMLTFIVALEQKKPRQA
jgi:hypothetical protein